jgi:predicted AlkP superfamily phosphohydrolase/phosphomutase
LVTRRKRAPQQQGTHRDEGILLIHGPDIEPVRGPEKQLFDVTATTLYLLGLGIPMDMDGAVIEEAISRSYLRDVPIQRNDADLVSPLQRSEDEMDQEDLAELASRLRALGYIE